MKDRVLNIVNNYLIGANDNLARANMQFGKMTDEELNAEYYQSGRTCKDIFDGYKNEVEMLKKCVKWVKAQN